MDTQTIEVFFVTPLGDKGSEARKRADLVEKYIVGPATKDLSQKQLELRLTRADKIDQPGRITYQVLKHLTESDLVIADITDSNPNVMYEVGIRHASVKPFVVLIEDGKSSPFDIADLRRIDYKLDLDGASTAATSLARMVQEGVTSKPNPLDLEVFGKRWASDTEHIQLDGERFIDNLAKLTDAVSSLSELSTYSSNLVNELYQAKLVENQMAERAQSNALGMQLIATLIEKTQDPEQLMRILGSFAAIGNNPTSNQVFPQPSRANRRSKKS